MQCHAIDKLQSSHSTLHFQELRVLILCNAESRVAGRCTANVAYRQCQKSCIPTYAGHSSCREEVNEARCCHNITWPSLQIISLASEHNTYGTRFVPCGIFKCANAFVTCLEQSMSTSTANFWVGTCHEVHMPMQQDRLGLTALSHLRSCKNTSDIMLTGARQSL